MALLSAVVLSQKCQIFQKVPEYQIFKWAQSLDIVIAPSKSAVDRSKMSAPGFSPVSRTRTIVPELPMHKINYNLLCTSYLHQNP
jgi:hypothetical protein